MTEQWYHTDEGDRVWWLDIPDDEGTYIFSFDKEKRFYLFGDYPDKLTAEEKAIFDADQPFWAEFFGGENERK